MKKILLYSIIVSAVVLFCLGFIEKESNNISNDNTKETISYGIDKLPEDLEKVTNLSKRQQDIICATSRGLVYKDADNKIVPSLASEVKRSEDGIQYEFKLRDDIYWSDGTKINPSDIVTFFKELLKEEDQENIQGLLNVYGAKQFIEGKVVYETGVAINKGENSVTIRLNEKDDNFLSELTKPQYRLKKYLVVWRDIKNNYNKLIYSGDYKIDSYDKEKITLKRNNNYSNKVNDDSDSSGNTESNNLINTIYILNDDSVEASMAAYEVKQRDIVINPPESELSKLSNENKLITSPETEAAYLVINSKNEEIPLQGRREIYNDVNKAIEEYQSSNDKMFEFAEGSFFREDKQDLTKLQTRKVISNKEGIWDKPQILTILGEDTDKNRLLCRTIEKWFKTNTDITIKYSLLKEAFSDEELKKRYDMLIISNQADINNKEKFYSNFKDYLTENQNALLENNLKNKKSSDYASLEESLFDNYSILPLAFYNENIAISDKISKLSLDGNGNISFDTIN